MDQRYKGQQYEICCDHIDLKKIYESGQCFRWKEVEPGVYFVIAGGRPALLKQKTAHRENRDGIDAEGITLFCASEDKNYFENYLDLQTDYGIFDKLPDPRDSYLRLAVQRGRGIRILRQELWETLISFIISQRNNIPRIISIIDHMARELGDPVSLEADGKVYRGYRFPDSRALLQADLSAFKLGYREKYIRKAAQDLEDGLLDLRSFLDPPLSEQPDLCREKLCRISGVGCKVADCVQLFALHQLSVFPVDTWIAKVEEKHYQGHFPIDRYQPWAGIMQQYMFYFERELDKGLLRHDTLYISDLDGTLLTPDAELDPEDALRLNQLIDRGLCLSVATARTYATVDHILKDLHLNYPIILMNGVMLYDPVARSCIHAEIINRPAYRYIMKGIRHFHVTGFVYTLTPDRGEGRKMMTYYEDLATDQMRNFCQERQGKYNKPFRQVKNLESLVRKDVIYLSFFHEEEKLRPFYEYLKENEDLNLSFYRDIYEKKDLWYLEVSDKNASKYHAAAKLREIYQPGQLVGFGDNGNDLPLFRACDLSCAVENAHDDIKSKVDQIIEANIHSGVVKYLEENFM